MTYANVSNLTGLVDVFRYANTNTTGWFGILILLITFIIVFMSVKSRFTTSRTLSSASFITLIVAILLRVLTLIGNFPFIVCVMLVFISIIYLRFDQEEF